MNRATILLCCYLVYLLQSRCSKSVRDKLEGLKVTAIYYSVSWFSFVAAIVLLAVGLFNANLALSEKGFYAMAYTLSIFAAIAVQKILLIWPILKMKRALSQQY